MLIPVLVVLSEAISVGVDEYKRRVLVIDSKKGRFYLPCPLGVGDNTLPKYQGKVPPDWNKHEEELSSILEHYLEGGVRSGKQIIEFLNSGWLKESEWALGGIGYLRESLDPNQMYPLESFPPFVYHGDDGNVPRHFGGIWVFEEVYALWEKTLES